MTMKQIIIDSFMSNEFKNFSIYNTTFAELSSMYDKVIAAIKNGDTLEQFLIWENAVTVEGRVKFDMTTDYYDKESKKTINNQKVVFKYPVYSYFWSEYKLGMYKIERQNKLIPLPIPA